MLSLAIASRIFLLALVGIESADIPNLPSTFPVSSERLIYTSAFHISVVIRKSTYVARR